MKLKKSHNGKGHPPTARGFNQAYADMILQRRTIVVRLRTGRFWAIEEIPNAMQQLHLKEQQKPYESRSGLPYVNPSNGKPWSKRTIINDLQAARTEWRKANSDNLDERFANLDFELESQKREAQAVPADRRPNVITNIIAAQFKILGGDRHEDSIPRRLVFLWFENFEQRARLEWCDEPAELERALKVFRASISVDDYQHQQLKGA